MLKRIKSGIKDIRIKRKVLIIYLFGILLPIISLLIFFAYQMKSQINNREDELIKSEITRIQLTINTMINTTNNLASAYFSDKNLNWALETFKNSETSKDSLAIIRNIDSQILSNQMVQPFIQQIDLFFDNESVHETTYAHYLSPNIKRSDWYVKFIASRQNTYVNTENQDNTPSILFIRKLNLLRSDSNNIIKMNLYPSSIQTHFESELLTKENCTIYLINEDNQIIVSNHDKSPKLFDEETFGSSKHLYRRDFDLDSLLKGWKVVIIPKQSILYSTLNKQILFLCITFLIVLLFSMLLFYGLAHTIIRRLEYIAGVMDQSKNDELIGITVDMGTDEIGITANRYNRMIDRIQSLMDENLKANNELQRTNEELITSIEVIENKERQIDELIYKDKLTGLANRFSITHFIDSQILTMNGNESFSVGFLDIDNFKLINDTYGHDVGDEIIKHTGRRLKKYENESIHIGRFGGDEFIITVKNFRNTTELKGIFNDIRVILKEAIIIQNITFLLTISMGISLFGIHSNRRHELIKLADIALYKAKELGRDQIVLFESSMNQALSEKLRRQASIREAMKHNTFLLYYQPYFDIRTHRIKGCEALLRWDQNSNLDMNPQELVQSIEEMGLMIEFGLWIIQEACLFAKALNESLIEPLPVSINISALQLMQNDFAEKVLFILEENNVDLRYIILEMTESVLMNSIEKGSSMIKKLHKNGIGISLDDFGTGYSSLKYFKELPVSILKIDKSFIDHIETNVYDEQLVDTMIQLAHNKNIQVIAEGVESAVQLDRLRNLCCDLVQGYLFSKPIDKASMLTLALSQNDI